MGWRREHVSWDWWAEHSLDAPGHKPITCFCNLLHGHTRGQYPCDKLHQRVVNTPVVQCSCNLSHAYDCITCLLVHLPGIFQLIERVHSTLPEKWFFLCLPLLQITLPSGLGDESWANKSLSILTNVESKILQPWRNRSFNAVEKVRFQALTSNPRKAQGIHI